ncbi:MAG: hypothetical protein EAX86_08475 [Candidatus Heimdallarchaeota archaeon]|nr:hypothetical protein [Candidatus Heimdallarchaeota archaeon]
MVPTLSSLLQSNHQVIQFFGLPGTYKTTLMVQIIKDVLLKNTKQIYLIDTSGNFPIIRLKSLKDLLRNLIVFHPRSLEEEVLLLDDISFQLSKPEIVLLVDDVFFHTISQNRENDHLNSYILAQLQNISKTLDFPIILTNQARMFEDGIHPYLQRLTLQYLNWHLHFEKGIKRNLITITIYRGTEFISTRNYSIENTGFLVIDD